MWTDELCEEYAEAMADTEQRRPAPSRGVVVIIDEGEVDMDLLVSLFE